MAPWPRTVMCVSREARWTRSFKFFCPPFERSVATWLITWFAMIVCCMPARMQTSCTCAQHMQAKCGCMHEHLGVMLLTSMCMHECVAPPVAEVVAVHPLTLRFRFRYIFRTSASIAASSAFFCFSSRLAVMRFASHSKRAMKRTMRNIWMPKTVYTGFRVFEPAVQDAPNNLTLPIVQQRQRWCRYL